MYIQVEMKKKEYQTDTQSEDPLFFFIQIANMMKRHLVLPVFPCENRGRAETFCNLCGHQPFHCHLSVIKSAELPVKEHMFFYNRYVPKVVKRDFRDAPIIYLKRVKSDCALIKAEVPGNIRCITIANKPVLPFQVVKRLKRMQGERVIRIHSVTMNFFESAV